MSIRRARALAQAGDTLVEVLIAISILSIAFVAILSGLGIAVQASSQHRAQATANTVLLSAAEAVKAASFTSCATTSTYDTSSGVTVPSGWTAPAVTAVQYWNGSSFFSGTCPSSPADRKLQMITIQAASPDGRATESITLVKRDPA